MKNGEGSPLFFTLFTEKQQNHHAAYFKAIFSSFSLIRISFSSVKSLLLPILILRNFFHTPNFSCWIEGFSFISMLPPIKYSLYSSFSRVKNPINLSKILSSISISSSINRIFVAPPFTASIIPLVKPPAPP